MQILVEEKGMMPVKKSGVKLHIGVDILGLPHMLLITSANITDRNGAIEMLSYYSAKSDRLIRLQKILVDGGYSGEEFADAVWAICGAEVEVAKRNELHKFAVIQKRWVVERSFGWLDKCRRFWKNCERLTHNTLQLISMAFIRIIANRYQTGSKNGADASPPRSVVSCLSYRGDGGKIVGELLPFQCILYIGFVVYLH